MGDDLLHLRRGPGTVWTRSRPDHRGHVQGDGNQCHARALSHPLQPGQVPNSIHFSHLGTASDTAVDADSG
ncbi:MAG: hypothetical protein ACK56I_09210, partial [bacterium]